MEEVIIRVPTQLRSLTQGSAEISVTGSTVGEALDALGKKFPGLSDRIFDNTGSIRRFVNIFLADEDVRFLDGADTVVTSGQTISIIPAVAGGCL